MKILRVSCMLGGFLFLALSLSAQTLTTLYSFTGGADGASPSTSLVQATDGYLYGTTYLGANGYGTVFRITPSGKLTPLYDFCPTWPCPDGRGPSALVQATDGNFYGTTQYGGANLSSGTVFKITPSGKLTTLYSFCSQSNCTDGAASGAPLVRATDGNFYGITSLDGANGQGGTVFKITLSGKLTTLYSFCLQTNCTDGGGPQTLIQATDGDLYGETW